MIFSLSGASVKAEEEEFVRVLESRKAAGEGKIKVVDINKKESEIEVTEIISLSRVIELTKETYPGLTHQRIPICNSAAPLEVDFDSLCNTLLGTPVNCPVIINCQVKAAVAKRNFFRCFSKLAWSYQQLLRKSPQNFNLPRNFDRNTFYENLRI